MSDLTDWIDSRSLSREDFEKACGYLDNHEADVRIARSKQICAALQKRAMKDLRSGPNDVVRQVYQGALMDAHRIAENPHG